MNILIDKLKKYLYETLGVEISVLPWKEQKKLPFFLIDSYTFFEASFLDNPYLLMISKNSIELTPNTIQKHWELIEKK